MKLFKYELKKILLKQYSLFLYLAVVLVTIFALITSPHQTYGFATVSERNEYLETIAPLTGELTQEKEQIITEMKEEQLSASAKLSEIYKMLSNGEIDENKCSELAKPYQNIVNKKDITESIFEKYEYTSADPEKRMLLPTDTVPALTDTSVNYLFLLCVTFCGAYAIMIEYSSKSRYILITTKGGQKATMTAKVGILLLLTAVTSILMSCFDIIKLANELPTDYWGYSLCSLPAFDTAQDISIISAFLSAQCLKLLGSLFICTAAMLTAHFTKNYVASVFPYIALPVVADYLAERDSQALFLPTGLLKGMGYFFGDRIEVGYASEADAVIYFHHVPTEFTTIMVITVLFTVVIGCAVLIKSGENRLNKK